MLLVHHSEAHGSPQQPAMKYFQGLDGKQWLAKADVAVSQQYN